MRDKNIKKQSLIYMPDTLATYETFAPYLPIPRTRQQVLYLARASKFPPYKKYLGTQTQPYWQKADLLAFWQERFAEFPKLISGLRKALATNKKKNKEDDRGEPDVND